MREELGFIAPLFVPGHRPELFSKAAASEADGLIIDLEDAVPFGLKDAARSALSTNFTRKPVIVRINGVGTPWYEDDVAAVAALELAAVMVPKAENRDDLVRIADLHPLVPLIETARGIAAAREIAAVSNVARLAFGSVDFAADFSCDHTREALYAARAELLMASKLNRITGPLDGVTTKVADLAAALDDARYSRMLGFAGKLCVHPQQVPAVLQGFRPTPEEIAWARQVVASGDGAVAVDGMMVDAPVRARAQAILSRCL